MVENSEENTPTPEEELEAFRNEVETAAVGSARGHFLEFPIDRSKITRRDFELAKKINKGVVTREDIESYKAGDSEDIVREMREALAKGAFPTSTEARVRAYLLSLASRTLYEKEKRL